MNGSMCTPFEGVVSVLSEKFPFTRHAEEVMQGARASIKIKSPTHVQEINIPAYSGSNPFVLRMIDYLEKYREDLVAALVHGSLATGEEIPYSDFDGLLIVKNEVMTDKKRLIRLARGIYASRSIMQEFDPLQHHGWFVISEAELDHYPETYLPTTVLHEARSILGKKDTILQLRSEEKPDYYSPLTNLCKQLRLRTGEGMHPKTMYQLKSMLSEFMMLPALYVQARDNKGIYKKYSFTEAAKDFEERDWKIMHDVSQLRKAWPSDFPAAERKYFGRIGYFWMRYRKKKGPLIPPSFREILDEDFYRRMHLLTNLVEINVFKVKN